MRGRGKWKIGRMDILENCAQSESGGETKMFNSVKNTVELLRNLIISWGPFSPESLPSFQIQTG